MLKLIIFYYKKITISIFLGILNSLFYFFILNKTYEMELSINMPIVFAILIFIEYESKIFSKKEDEINFILPSLTVLISYTLSKIFLFP